MEANPFATTLHIAIAGLRMPKKTIKQWKTELHTDGLSLWDGVTEAIRAALYAAGIDVSGVGIEIRQDTTEEQERYCTITGIRSDEAATVRAIFEEYCVVTDDDYDPADDDGDDEEDRWWRGEEEDA